jgi:hypothetical protein
MSSTQATFDQLQAELQRGGVEAVLDRLIAQLRESKKYHELFEALKMRVRHSLALPLLYAQTGDNLDEALRDKLEDGLIEACREVGLLLLQAGNVREGWMYLRPVGDREAAAREVAKIEADDENIDELVEVCLHEGVDAKRGFELVLEHYGTCNAITTFESAMPRRSKPEQQAAAGVLVQHVHQELTATIKADIAQQEGSEPPQSTLRELVADREWLFADNAYHIDTTHLAATVRFSRILSDPAQLRLAVDLTEYGRRLSSQFQYQSDEPFADMYPSHALYLRALVGENVDEAIAYFREKAEQSEVAKQGTVSIEFYIDLLARLGRYEEAIDATIQLIPAGIQPLGYAPSLLELSQQAGNYNRLMQYCRDRDDLLGFTAGLVHANRNG